MKSGSIEGSVLGPVLFLMFIQDISEDMTVNTKVFVDDTKLKEKILGEEDVIKVQENLDTLYKWQENNNMQFNGTKFQVLRYGLNEDVKNDTIYFTDNMENIIERFSSVKDLGMILSDDARFEEHIEKVSKTVRQKVGWITRTFFTRNTDHMKHLWKTLVQCHIDYCSQIYMPGQGQGMLAIEKLFYNYSRLIPEVREDDYWTRLQKLKMLSQERRMERYRIIYIWKILEDLAPNCGVHLTVANERLGRKVKIPSLIPGGRQAIQTLREQSFQIHGARLFNCLPKKIRNIRIYQEDFKEALDRYIEKIPDQPKMNTLVPTATHRVTGKQSNSLIAWIQET